MVLLQIRRKHSHLILEHAITVDKENSKNTLNHFITKKERIIRILDDMTDSDYINIEEIVWVRGDTLKTSCLQEYMLEHIWFANH